MLIHVDGFDIYNDSATPSTDLYNAYICSNVADMIDISPNRTNMATSTTEGRYSQGCAYSPNVLSCIQKTFYETHIDIWTGIAFYYVFDYDEQTFSFIPSTGLTTTYNIDADRSIFIFCNDNWSACVTVSDYTFSTEAMVTYNSLTSVWRFWTIDKSAMCCKAQEFHSMLPQQWHWIEVHYKSRVDDVGVFELWVDGICIITYTGVTASNFNSITTVLLGSTANVITISDSTSNSSQLITPLNYVAKYDDWYILDVVTDSYNMSLYNTTRLGDSRVYTLIPTSDAGPNTGTPLEDKLHYTQVNELNTDKSPYISMPVRPNEEELFGMTSLSIVPTIIRGMKVSDIFNSDTYSVYGVFSQVIATSNGSVADGTYNNSYSFHDGPVIDQADIYEYDPDTGTLWTAYGINNANCGVDFYGSYS